MSVAERTRDAVRREPFLLDALRAGVVNYSAAARHLPVEGDEESVATALRRFAEELDAAVPSDCRASVRLRRGVGLLEATNGADAGASASADGEPLLAVGGVAIGGTGDHAAVLATGDVDPLVLEEVVGMLRAADVDVVAAGAAGDELLVAVGKRAGPEALRLVEAALE